MMWQSILGLPIIVACIASISSTVITFTVDTKEPTYTYETSYYNQRIDHFSFANESTFKQKYLINDTWWKSNGGPIFFYTGNEGNIESFAQNTGFMWDIAPEFGAMLVFAEHRYYGTSLPFGKEGLKPNPSLNGYLTSEQALADFAELITFLKANTKGAEKSPVIAFGGSYGGMLAAWFRQKYPHICDGAIAASAPVAQFNAPCDAFNRIVTSDYTTSNPNCSETIRNSWNAIATIGKDENGKKWLSSTFGLCKTMTKDDEVTALKDYLADIYVNIAMMNYPYPTSFLKPLPGNPVDATCDKMMEALDVANVTLSKDQAIVAKVAKGASVYYNYTGSLKCLNIDNTDDIGADMWDYQACTEMVFPMCADGVNDMFEASTWNYTEYALNCQKKWKVMPRRQMASMMYGEKKIHAASNIVFSNGLLDPWVSGGIIRDINPTVVAPLIPKGAHHLDLRGNNINDPTDVRMVRKVEKDHISSWINDVYSINKKAVKQQGPSLNNFLPGHAAAAARHPKEMVDIQLVN